MQRLFQIRKKHLLDPQPENEHNFRHIAYLFQEILKQILHHVVTVRRQVRVQSDAIRWEQLEKWHFSRGYNFWTNDLILILKTPTRSYLCLEKIFFCSELVLTCCSKVVGLCKLSIAELFRSDCFSLQNKCLSIKQAVCLTQVYY